jgi:hypothetical protein
MFAVQSCVNPWLLSLGHPVRGIVAANAVLMLREGWTLLTQHFEAHSSSVQWRLMRNGSPGDISRSLTQEQSLGTRIVAIRDGKLI